MRFRAVVVVLSAVVLTRALHGEQLDWIETDRVTKRRALALVYPLSPALAREAGRRAGALVEWLCLSVPSLCEERLWLRPATAAEHLAEWRASEVLGRS